MNITSIVRNGCDSYEIGDEPIFTKNAKYEPFRVVEIEENTIEFDADGELILDGIFAIAGGKGWTYYRAIDIMGWTSYRAIDINDKIIMPHD